MIRGEGNAATKEPEPHGRPSIDKSLYQGIERWLGYRWVGAFLIAAAIVLPLFRQRGTASWDTVWAEDVTIYTHQAVFYGSLHTLFRGYNGYLQLPPRLLAFPIPYFSLRYLALYSAVAATLVGALLAWSVYYLSRQWLQSRLLRVALASGVVLMPALGPESTATITNTTWMFLAVLPWALISLEERRRDSGLRSVLAVLGATSSALSFVFLPLAIGWVIYRRSKSALIVGASFLVGLIIQGGVSLASSPPMGANIDIPVLTEATSVRVFGAFLLGVRGESVWWSANWVSLAVLAPLIVIVALIALGISTSRRRQITASAFVILAAVLFAIPAWGRDTIYLALGPSGLIPGHHDHWGESRFSVVPVMLLASATAILIAPMGSSAKRQRDVQRIAIPIFALWILMVTLTSFSSFTPPSQFRGEDPSWMTRIDQVLSTECSHRPRTSIVTVPNLVSPPPPYHRVPNGLYPLVVRCANLE